MKYEILDKQGMVINTILASQSFVEEHYPTSHRLVVEGAKTPPTAKEDPVKDKLDELKVIVDPLEAKLDAALAKLDQLLAPATKG